MIFQSSSSAFFSTWDFFEWSDNYKHVYLQSNYRNKYSADRQGKKMFEMIKKNHSSDTWFWYKKSVGIKYYSRINTVHTFPIQDN